MIQKTKQSEDDCPIEQFKCGVYEEDTLCQCKCNRFCSKWGQCREIEFYQKDYCEFSDVCNFETFKSEIQNCDLKQYDPTLESKDDEENEENIIQDETEEVKKGNLDTTNYNQNTGNMYLYILTTLIFLTMVMMLGCICQVYWERMQPSNKKSLESFKKIMLDDTTINSNRKESKSHSFNNTKNSDSTLVTITDNKIHSLNEARKQLIKAKHRRSNECSFEKEFIQEDVKIQYEKLILEQKEKDRENQKERDNTHMINTLSVNSVDTVSMLLMELDSNQEMVLKRDIQSCKVPMWEISEIDFDQSFISDKTPRQSEIQVNDEVKVKTVSSNQVVNKIYPDKELTLQDDQSVKKNSTDINQNLNVEIETLNLNKVKNDIKNSETDQNFISKEYLPSYVRGITRFKTSLRFRSVDSRTKKMYEVTIKPNKRRRCSIDYNNKTITNTNYQNQILEKNNSNQINLNKDIEIEV